MLNTLMEMPDELLEMPVPLAIATLLWKQYIAKQWKPTTLFKYLCTAQGALRILPLYRNRSPSVLLSKDVAWSMIMKGARHMAVEHIPKQPKAATINELFKAIRAADGFYKKHVRVAIILAWLTTGRMGCIRKLKSEDFEFLEEKKVINITFHRGKGVRAREQAYTVTTLIVSDHWWKEIKEFVHKRPGFLFPLALKDTAITTPLKAAGIEQRSIRRGALQIMAAQKVPPAVLMNFSGHTSEKTLNRYLDFGKKRADLQEASMIAAKALWDEKLDAAWLEEDEDAETTNQNNRAL